MNKPTKLVGSAEACQMLNVNRSTLTRWAKAGRIKPQTRLSDHTNGALAFRRADVEKLAAERAAGSES